MASSALKGGVVLNKLARGTSKIVLKANYNNMLYGIFIGGKWGIILNKLNNTASSPMKLQ